jgi:hypothetical protein
LAVRAKQWIWLSESAMTSSLGMQWVVVVEAARIGNREALAIAKTIEQPRQRYFATREAAIELLCLGDASMLDELIKQKSVEA